MSSCGYLRYIALSAVGVSTNKVSISRFDPLSPNLLILLIVFEVNH